MAVNITLVVLLFSFTTTLKAQSDHESHTDHDHGLHQHKNEIGIAAAPVYFFQENTVSLGLHFHFVRSLGQSGLGVGVGYERIFDEHGHNTFGVLLSYRPADRLTLSLSPGLTIEDEDPGHASLALHTEVAYEFSLGDFHVGPLIELAIDPEDVHLSVGLHVGIGF